jgi:eukaryotic-like serine/threonine-protein kinase
MPGTQMGMILGTAGYMSPEQARGKEVDKRADIWAFGVVLYEMVTGQRLFEGETVSDSLAAVLTREPDLAQAPEKTRRLLASCLEKDPKKRLRDIGDWARLLEDRTALPISDSTPAPSTSRQGWGRRALAAIVLTAAVSIAATAAATRLLWRDAAPPVWTASILGGPTNSKYPRLSPDGQLLAFYAFVDELPQLGVMKPDGGSWTMLTSARDSGYVTAISWSPDSSKIYFDRYWGQPRGVFSVPPLGGEPRLLLEDAFDPESLPDGSLIVARLTDQGDHQLFHFWPESGKLEPLPAFITPTDVGNVLRASPDGKQIVYFGEGGPETRTQSPNVYVFDLACHVSRRLLPDAKIRAHHANVGWPSCIRRGGRRGSDAACERAPAGERFASRPDVVSQYRWSE